MSVIASIIIMLLMGFTSNNIETSSIFSAQYGWNESAKFFETKNKINYSLIDSIYSIRNLMTTSSTSLELVKCEIVQKITINQENPINLSEIKKLLPTYFHQCTCTGVYSFIHGKHGSQSTHDCIPNGVENLGHNLFLSVVALPTKIKSIFHHTHKLGCYCKQLDTPPLCENRTCSFATNWQFFHLFIHLFDVHCPVYIRFVAKLVPVPMFRRLLVFSFARFASAFACVAGERWWCIMAISISNSCIFFDNRTKSNGPDCWIVNKCFLLYESHITRTIILNAIFVLQLCIGWLYGWVLVCVCLCVRKGIQNTPKNWNFFHLYIDFDIIEIVTWMWSFVTLTWNYLCIIYLCVYSYSILNFVCLWSCSSKMLGIDSLVNV